MNKLPLISTIIVSIVSFMILAFTVRGTIGNPIYYQTEKDTKVGGPFEASNSTARFALVESIVKNNSLFLDQSLAKFSAPDVVQYKGKFISIFTPGVSLIAVPFYLIGQLIGLPQLVAFLSVTVFGFLNIFLVAKLAKLLGSNWSMGLLSGFTFLFATNALPYSHSLTQHLMSTGIILLALLSAIGKRTYRNNILFGAFFVISALIDIPNAMMLIPVLLYVVFNHIEVKKRTSTLTLSMKTLVLTLAIGAIPFLAIFGWYNYATTGSVTTLAQNIGRSDAFKGGLPSHISDTNAKSDEGAKLERRASLPFNSRTQLSSLYTLLISTERAWIFYSPVVLLGIFGAYILYKNKTKHSVTTLLITVILTNIVIYSMFGDPWGGWAFGPRYLIPSAAILSALLGYFLTVYRRNYIVLAIFTILMIYSVWVNTLGAITTSVIPPRVEAINLPEPIPYTYEYNLILMSRGQVSSLIYNLYLIDILTPYQFHTLLMITIGSTAVFLYGLGYLGKGDKE